MNHTRYDRDDFNPDFPAVSENEECHVEKQYKEGKWFIPQVLVTGFLIGMLVLHVFGGL